MFGAVSKHILHQTQIKWHRGTVHIGQELIMSVQAQRPDPPIKKIIIVYVVEDTHAGKLFANLDYAAVIAIVVPHVIYKRCATIA